ncbi:F0F1 ATP synthase subunit delta [Celeribacter indicus]|uniref:ATP synthase subunit delta n=1 Tax=Celeribacter indicus TaxID=1208324 RepID=A0A0B5E4T5_9RHOB|nr:F0F1 ATP synthase subunit delta [Celeribacter indicus]AJE48365.1 ATP synthase subunit delta [Celeribacter indicus]SDW73939.1 ATP synthase F1 subcomplex delta subunit [Celeribacter indicus]
MSEPASISRGIAARYATAIFELAKEGNSVKALEADVATLAAALSESDDLRALVTSPIYSRDELETAITAIAARAGLSGVVTNTLALMARNRRLFVLPQLVDALQAMLAEERGEVVAEVVSAKALTQAQTTKLAGTLSETFGKQVTVNATVDESLIGGLIVKVGSKMIDTSIASKLNSLQNAMKEVG